MICFPNAKINLGLFITQKRSDGYHNLESFIIPTGPVDMLEFLEAGKDELSMSGITRNIALGNNLLFTTLDLLRKEFDIPPLKMHLHKQIPSGAGLGGGSSDASFFLKNLNEHFGLGLNREELKEKAAHLGSDCPFFILNKPSFVFGRGEIIKEKNEDTDQGLYLQLYNPGIHISTQTAFSGIRPATPSKGIGEIINSGIDNWKDGLSNDFEDHLFRVYPKLSRIKEELYSSGAVYASMSGSGSSVYGIFREKVPPPENLSDMLIWEGHVPLPEKEGITG